jgi:hypothetical protein
MNDAIKPPAPAASAKKPEAAPAQRRPHSLNTATLEVNAAADLRSYEDGKWATVFAIHNKYRGKDREPQAVPLTVKFGGNTAAYAIKAIRKGTHFVVSGQIDYDQAENGKEFYRIDADQLRVITPREADKPEAA